MIIVLFVSSLTESEQRLLRHFERSSSHYLARHASIILFSARHVPVSVIAATFNCGRRTVRRWIHRFSAERIRGLLRERRGRPLKNPLLSAHHFSKPDQQQTAQANAVPIIPLTVPEVRRLLTLVWTNDFKYARHDATFRLRWSVYRRYKQALAKISHYKKRGAPPPSFASMPLKPI